jgi:hypothetical protein
MNRAVALLSRHRAALFYGVAGLAMFVFANLRSPLPNEDGVLYLMLAERISEGGLASGFDLFDRPLYSGMIAVIHGITGLGFVASAHVLNASCVLGMVAAFLLLCRTLYDDASVVPWAAALLLAHPKINNYFAFVIRDLGYWCLLLTALVFFLRFVSAGGRHRLAGWAVCVLLAAAFKPEALAFGAVLPLALLWRGRWRALRDAAFAWSLILLPLGAAALLLGTRAGALAPPARELPQLPGDLLAAIPRAFSEAAARYAQGVLDPYSHDVAGLSLAGGLLTILVFKLLNTLGPAQVLLVASGRRLGGILPAEPLRPAFFLALGCGTLMAGLFVAYRQFLDTRYVMVPALLLLALAARALQGVARQCLRVEGTRRLVAIAAIPAVLLLDWGLGLDRSKPHMLACIEWMRATLAPGTHLFTNDKQLAAASGLHWEWDEVRDVNLVFAEGRAPFGADTVWAIRLREGQENLAQALARESARLVPITQFTGEKGDRIVLLRPLPDAVQP